VVGDYVSGADVGGTRAVVCPNVSSGIQCVDCGLCARQRKSTVIFPIHGARRKSAAAAIARRCGSAAAA